MKFKIIMLLLVSIGLFNCNSEENETEEDVIIKDETIDDGGSDDGGAETVLVNYVDDVAGIISTNCLECHGETRRNGATINLHTFELVRDASDNVDFRMNNNVNPMPIESRGGLIAEADRAIISQWIADGLLEN